MAFTVGFRFRFSATSPQIDSFSGGFSAGQTGQFMAEALASLNLPGRESRRRNSNRANSSVEGDVDIQRIITMMAEKQKEDDQVRRCMKITTVYHSATVLKKFFF